VNKQQISPHAEDGYTALLAQHQDRYSAAIRQARQAGDGAFQAWFNRESSHTIQQCVVRGYWDFAVHILTPGVCAWMHNPEEKVALEIGYGGGRLLNAACSYFNHAIGIDIHEETAAAEAFLQSQHKQNYTLLRTSGTTIDVADESIDFVYSFIVLQHLPAFVVFELYIQEVYRCLKVGGVAQLYFGKFTRLHPLYQVRYWLQGYKETRGKPANHISLVIRLARVRQVCNQVGFHIVESGTSFFQSPNGYPDRPGGQSYVTLVKRGSR
jgi:SAM-dependent methyltransferase